MKSQPLISFCTTCMGRLHHLRKTLPSNLVDNAGFADVEFVLLDYSSPDGLADWVKDEFSAELESGRLVFYQLAGATEFRVSHAKNLAHRLARGEIVCNVDADNFTGPGFASHLAELFANRSSCFAYAHNTKGATGRIAMRRSHFDQLRGYDERMDLGWGTEDMDLIYRAELLGLASTPILPASRFLRVIEHSDEERVRFFAMKSKAESSRKFRQLSKESTDVGEFAANQGNAWGAGVVVRNFGESVRI